MSDGEDFGDALDRAQEAAESESETSEVDQSDASLSDTVGDVVDSVQDGAKGVQDNFDAAAAAVDDATEKFTGDGQREMGDGASVSEAMAAAGATPGLERGAGRGGPQRTPGTIADAIRESVANETDTAVAREKTDAIAETGSTTRAARVRADVLRSLPDDANVSPSDISVESRQISPRAQSFVDTAAGAIGVESPQDIRQLEVSLNEEARESVVKQQIAEEEGVPEERVRVQGTSEDGVSVQIEPEPFLGDQLRAIAPGDDFDFTGGGGPGTPGPSPATLTGPNRGVVRPALQDVTATFESEVSDPIRGGGSTPERAARGLTATGIEFLEPASSVNFALGGVDTAADISQETLTNPRVGSVGSGPGITRSRGETVSELEEDIQSAQEAAGERAESDPVVAGAEFAGAAIATGLPFAARSPRLRSASRRGRVSARQFVSDESAMLGRGRTRGSDDVADTADEGGQLLDADALADVQALAERPSVTPTVRAMRERASSRFERFNRGRDPVTPSEGRGPGGDFVAERVSGREVPDTGPDTGRSGLPDQQAANQARFKDVFDDDLSPLERQLRAQGQTESAAVGVGGREGALSGLIAAQEPTVTPFDEASGPDGESRVFGSALSMQSGTLADTATEPDVTADSDGMAGTDSITETLSGAASRADTATETVTDTVTETLSAADSRIDVDARTNVDTETDVLAEGRERQQQRQDQRENQRQDQRQRQRGRSRGRERGRTRERGRQKAQNVMGRARIRDRSRSRRRLPDLDIDPGDDEREEIDDNVDIVQDTFTFETPTPSDVLEEGVELEFSGGDSL